MQNQTVRSQLFPIGYGAVSLPQAVDDALSVCVWAGRVYTSRGKTGDLDLCLHY